MEQVARRSQDILAPKLRALRSGVRADLVILGASRCHHHYVPSILSDTLNMSVYNAGVGGSDNIFSHYLVLCHILEHSAPKIICLELMPADYAQEKHPFHALAFFAPLYGQCSEADSLYRLAGSYWKYYLSHLYRYNAKASSNIIGLLMDRQKNSDNGYIPLPQPTVPPSGLLKADTATLACDSLKTTFIQRFIAKCQSRGITLVFVVSPRLTVANKRLYEPLKTIAHENNIPFMDYHSQGLFHDRSEYFKDELHLWDEGARHYSSVFASDLKHLLGKKQKNLDWIISSSCRSTAAAAYTLSSSGEGRSRAADGRHPGCCAANGTPA